MFCKNDRSDETSQDSYSTVCILRRGWNTSDNTNMSSEHTANPDVNGEQEDDIDPVEAVRKAVNGADKTEFDDGHELKRLIKNENGVTLPEAGKFMLKALRADDPPIERGPNGFTQNKDSSGTPNNKEEDTAGGEGSEDGQTGDTGEDGEETDEGEEGQIRDETVDPYEGLPEKLKRQPVWSAPSENDRLCSLEEAVERASDPCSVGYQEGPRDSASVVTICVEPSSEASVYDSLPEPPFDGVYAYSDSSGSRIRVPVLGYEVPEWWTDTESEDCNVRVSTEELRTPNDPIGEAGDSVKQGGRDVDAWLGRVRHKFCEGSASFASHEPETEELDVEGVQLTDDLVREALDNLDPDLPYPEWRRIGYAVLDNYDETEEEQQKAQEIFLEWTRQGDLYHEDVQDEYLGPVGNVDRDTGTDEDVGYLIHKACLEGWVWEPGSETEPDAEREDETGEEDVAQEHSDGSRPAVPVGTAAETKKHPPGDTSRGRFRLEETEDGYGYTAAESGGEEVLSRVTNFTIEPQVRVNCSDGSRLLRFTVNPSGGHSAEPNTKNPVDSGYDVEVAPSVFNDADVFRREVVTGFSTWFEGDGTTLNRLREVASDSRTVRGSYKIGLHPDTGEFVTPEGTVDGEGWSEKPESVFVRRGRKSLVERRWTPSPDSTETEGGADVVGILESLPEMRDSEGSLTVLGWFYAAPLKPYIVGFEGEFPVLWITDGSRSGREAVRILNRAFGGGGSPCYVDNGLQETVESLASSRSVPVWYDGYRPSGVDERILESFHGYCRRTVRCSEISVDDRVRSLTAPVVVTGDTPRDSSLADRSMETGLAPVSPEDEGGIDAVLDLRDSDLAGHAFEYYSWTAQIGEDEIRHTWNDCRETAASLVDSSGPVRGRKKPGCIGVAVTLFGLRMYQRFAEDMGAEPGVNAYIDASETEPERKNEEEDKDIQVTDGGLHRGTGRGVW